jgi:CDP-diglyceride synthetase
VSAPAFVVCVQMLLLLGVANGSPIVAKRVCGLRYAQPLDGGLPFIDGRPLLGASKTWRGLIVAVATCALAAPLCGVSMALGALIGAGAMAGDALASFIKRRLGLLPGDRALGLDQIPEALLPLLVVRDTLDLGWPQILAVTFAFSVLALPLSRLFFKLGLRDRPY